MANYNVPSSSNPFSVFSLEHVIRQKDPNLKVKNNQVLNQSSKRCSENQK